MSMSKESWERAMVNAYSLGLIGTMEVSSCASGFIDLPPGMTYQPVQQEIPVPLCDYCRGHLTGKEKECPGCGARSSK